MPTVADGALDVPMLTWGLFRSNAVAYGLQALTKREPSALLNGCCAGRWNCWRRTARLVRKTVCVKPDILRDANGRKY